MLSGSSFKLGIAAAMSLAISPLKHQWEACCEFEAKFESSSGYQIGL